MFPEKNINVNKPKSVKVAAAGDDANVAFCLNKLDIVGFSCRAHAYWTRS